MLLQMAKFHSSLFLSTISLYIFVCVCVCVCVCIYIPHLLYPFICWWTLMLVPYLGSSIYVAAINIGIHVYFQINVFVFFGYIYPGVELLHHIVVLFLEKPPLVSTVAAPTYIIINSVQGFPFSISLSTFVICGPFGNSHSDRHEEISPCGFDFHFSDN